MEKLHEIRYTLQAGLPVKVRRIVSGKRNISLVYQVHDEVSSTWWKRGDYFIEVLALNITIRNYLKGKGFQCVRVIHKPRVIHKCSVTHKPCDIRKCRKNTKQFRH